MSDSPTTRFAEQRTPCCGYLVDGATDMQIDPPHRPEPGDVTVCWNCGTFLCVVDDRVLMRIAKPSDLATLTPSGLELAIRGQAYVRKRGRLE